MKLEQFKMEVTLCGVLIDLLQGVHRNAIEN